jgi:hypothetical protein
MVILFIMSFNNGPEFLFGYEDESGLSAIERLDLLAELESRKAEVAHELAAKQINQDPALHALLGKIVEGGAELDSVHQSHIRRMIALKLYGLPEEAVQSETNHTFYLAAATTVRAEIDELYDALGNQELSDPWDTALRDLTSLEDN